MLGWGYAFGECLFFVYYIHCEKQCCRLDRIVCAFYKKKKKNTFKKNSGNVTDKGEIASTPDKCAKINFQPVCVRLCLDKMPPVSENL